MSQFYNPELTSTVTGSLAHHILNVRRIEKGEVIKFFDGKGRVVLAKLKNFSKKPLIAEFDFLKEEKVKKAGFEVYLYMSIIKPDAIRDALDKTTQIGITKIVPIRSQRSFRGKMPLERLRKVVISACEQSERAFVPALDETQDFLIAIKDCIKRNFKVYFLERGSPPLFINKGEGKVAFFIGPEGGWSEFEIETARKCGAVFASISENSLRSETAAVCAVSIFVNIQGG